MTFLVTPRKSPYTQSRFMCSRLYNAYTTSRALIAIRLVVNTVHREDKSPRRDCNQYVTQIYQVCEHISNRPTYFGMQLEFNRKF